MVSDRCTVGAGCSLDSKEALPTGTVIYGRECHRYNKKIPTQVYVYTVEPPNNGHIGDEHFVHCSEVVPSSEVEMYGQYVGRG